MKISPLVKDYKRRAFIVDILLKLCIASGILGILSLSISSSVYAQQIPPQQITGIAAVLSPPSDQQVAQPVVSGSQTTLRVNSFNGVLEATAFPGSDIGEKINNAYAALPPVGGKITIDVPVNGLSFTTPIVFGVLGKPVYLECNSSRTSSNPGITFTGQNGSAITFNYGQPTQTSYGSGIHNCTFFGSDDQTKPTSGATGITWGGSNGAVGLVIENSTISRFSTGMSYVANSWSTLAKNVHISALANNLGTCLNVTSSDQSGEQITFENMEFDGCFGSAMIGGDGGIKLGGAGMHVNFIASSFDDATVVDTSSGSYFIDPHFENPGQNEFYVFYTHTGGNAAMTNPVFVPHPCVTSCPPALMSLSGGTLSMVGFSSFGTLTYAYLSGNGSVTSLSPAAVFPSAPVAMNPIAGTTTGHYLWDLGPQVGATQFLTNFAFTINGPGIMATTDQFMRWGTLLDGGILNSTSPRLYMSRTSNLVDTLSGKITMEDETPSCNGYGTGIGLWTQSGGSGPGDQSSLSATFDCHGNLHLKGALFIGDPGTAGSQGFTGNCPSSATLTVKGGIITGCS